MEAMQIIAGFVFSCFALVMVCWIGFNLFMIARDMLRMSESNRTANIEQEIKKILK